MEVLTNPKYTVAAQAMSVKIRARKNTPVQEAAGVHSLLLSQHSSSVGDPRHATPVGSHNPCLSLVNQILHFECMGKAAKESELCHRSLHLFC